jgi:hypothetical protein
MRSTAARGRRLARPTALALAAMAWAGVGVGCCSPKQAIISTDPGGAKLSVNGKDIGAADKSYQFDFCHDVKQYDVTATQDGYFDATAVVKDDSPGLNDKFIKLTLVADQAHATTEVPTDPANQWAIIQASPGLTKDVVWQKMVSVVTDRFTHLTVLDATSGHLESATHQKEFPNPSQGSMTIRTQLVASISSEQPLVYKVKLVSQVGYGASPDKWTDYPRVYKEEAKLIDSIRDQIGVRQTPGE